MLKYIFWGLPTWAAISGLLWALRGLIWGSEDSDTTPPDIAPQGGRTWARESHRASQDFGGWMNDPDGIDNATGMPVEDILAGQVGAGHGVANSDE